MADKQRIAQDIAALRKTSAIVQRLAASHIDGIAEALLHTLPKDENGAPIYTYAVLETAVGGEIAAFPFLQQEREGSPQDLAAKAAEREKNPTTEDYRKMPTPGARLEAINRVKLREMEEAASRDAKAAGIDREAVGQMSATERLTLANKLKVRAETKIQKPVTREMLARMSAAEKLSHANQLSHTQHTDGLESDE